MRKIKKRRKRRKESAHFSPPAPDSDPAAWVMQHEALIRETMKRQFPPKLSLKRWFFDGYAAGIWLGELTGNDLQAAGKLSGLIRQDVAPYVAARIAADAWLAEE